MIKRNNLGLMFVGVLVVLIGANSAGAVELLEPGYIAETYATYSASGIGRGPYSMVFVPDGNLYVTHIDDDTLWRITPEGVATEFVSVNQAPQGIVWGGGTNFHDYLYVRFDGNRIVRVGLDGTISNFANRYCTGALGIDRTGNYGGYMYTTTGCQDHTYRIDFNGNVSYFSNFPGWTDGGGPHDIGFDIQGNYGGLMYIAVEFSNSSGNQHKSGLFSLDPGGNSSRFAGSLVRVGRVEFDLAGLFGGEMYVMGTLDYNEINTLWRVRPDGIATEFAQTSLSQGISDLTFGPDGAMYVGEYDENSQTVIISRISSGVLESLEIVGPNEVGENFSGQYRAIAHYEEGFTRDVTSLAVWSVEPGTLADIDEKGLLTTGDVEIHKEVVITAQYSEGGIDAEDDKEVLIQAICPSGSALEFDGVNDYVDLGNDSSLKPSLPITVSAWIKIDVLNHVHQIFKSDKSPPYYYGIWFYVMDASNLQISYGDGGIAGPPSRRTKVGTTSLKANIWYHVAAVINGPKDMSIYIDGIDDGGTYSGTGGNLTYSNGNVRIGNRENMPLPFDGTIDEIAIYNRALTADEIRALMHTRPEAGEPDLVGYWNFDEGEGQVAGDSSSNGNDGQLGSSLGEDASDPGWVLSDAPVGICNNVAVDIKPGDCPNPLNLNSKGVLPVAILGSADFDVSTIDTFSIKLAGVGGIRSTLEDVGSPGEDGDGCECTTEGPDGILDLNLKFSTQEIVDALIRQYDELSKGQYLELTLRAELIDGGSIIGTDCVKLVGNVPKWLGARKCDTNEDGIVNLLDLSEMAKYWLEQDK